MSGQEDTIEGCKSLHFHHPCRLPARHGPEIQAEASEKRPAVRREEVNKAALQGLDMERRDPEGHSTKVNIILQPWAHFMVLYLV